jgi:hypothetical protein
MAKEDEFIRYVEYIRENYPTTIWLSKEKHIAKLSNLHSATYDNVIIYEIIKNWHIYNSLPGFTQFLDDYKEYISSILIAIPANHPGFIGYLIRSASESLLKYLYSYAYPSCPEEKVAKTPFRHLKDELKLVYKTNPTYPRVIDLLNLYGKYSKEIHLHITNNANSLGTINFYIDNFFSSINNDLLEIIKLVDLFTVLTSFTLNFKYHENTLASQKRLERNLDQSRLSIIQS